MMQAFRTDVFRTGLVVLVTGCGLQPSSTPLGGNYASPEAPTAKNHTATARVEPKSEITLPAATPVTASAPPSSPSPAVVTSTAAAARDELRYVPLKAGDRVAIELSLAISADAIADGSAAMGGSQSFRMQGNAHLDVKITRASPQALDELELTFVPGNFQGAFGKEVINETSGRPKTYDVTLTGNHPGVVKHGASIDDDSMQQALIGLLVLPLSEFHEHWAATPTLELKPGWSSTVPLSLPAFMTKGRGTVSVGPLAVRYSGREQPTNPAPFTLSLPCSADFGVGKVKLDLTGSARLSAAQARPIALNVTGPVSGDGSIGNTHLGLHGTAKLDATLSYP